MNSLVCVRVGDKYPVEYVHKLASMARRHLTVPYTFYCLTDDPTDIEERTIVAKSLPKSWWAKLYLFNVLWASARVVYIDLDTLIVGNIDFLFQYQGKFAIIRDWWQPCYNSSVMAFPSGYGYQHWWNYLENQKNIEAHFHSDQEYLTARIPDADLWDPNMMGSYKAHGLDGGPKSFPIVCFHGEPKPHQFTKGWVHELWN